MTELNKNAVHDYLLYGNTTAIIASDKTGNDYTLRIERVNNRYYCEYLPNNCLSEYVAIYDAETGTVYPREDLVFGTRPMWARAIIYTLYHLDNLPEWVHIYATHCPRCGKPLTSSWSRARGFGKECYKRRHKNDEY